MTHSHPASHSHPPPTSAFVIAVLNQKGGVGKSTVAQNLASAAFVRGTRTLLLDLDRQGTSFDWFAKRAASSPLRGLQVSKADRAWSLAQFSEMSAGYDLVVCDGPARLSNVSTAAAVAADVVLIPMRVGHGEWWAAAENEEMLDAADSLRTTLGMKPVRRVYVLNEVFANVRETGELVEALGTDVELLPVRLHHRVAYDRARGLGEATVTLDPSGPAAAEVFALCDHLAEMGAAHVQ